MRTLLIAAAVAAIAAPSIPAHAQAGNRDIRCLMLSNLFARVSPAPQAKEAANQARLFYIGRVTAKLTPAQIEPAMATAAKAINIDHAGPEMNTCLASVQSSAATIETAGRKAQIANRGTAKPTP